jgi:hypothetical protein
VYNMTALFLCDLILNNKARMMQKVAENRKAVLTSSPRLARSGYLGER